MGRKMIDREEAVRNFVRVLTEKNPTSVTFNRGQLEEVGDENLVGFQYFTSKTKGIGNQTRLSHGVYVIPESLKPFTAENWAGRITEMGTEE